MQTRPYVLWWSSPSQLATNDQQAKSSHISGRSRICQTGWGGRPRRRAQRRALMGVWATASSRVQGQTPRRWKLFVNFHRKEGSKVTDLNDSLTSYKQPIFLINGGAAAHSAHTWICHCLTWQKIWKSACSHTIPVVAVCTLAMRWIHDCICHNSDGGPMFTTISVLRSKRKPWQLTATKCSSTHKSYIITPNSCFWVQPFHVG